MLKMVMKYTERSKRVPSQNERLYPSRFDPGYYILTLLRTYLSEIKKFIKNGAMLVDIGCGDMSYRSIFEPEVIKYIGIDLPGNNQPDIFVDSSGMIPLRNCCADVVLSTQVLEHVDDPLRCLKEYHRILRPEGLLILSTHGYWAFHPCPEDYWRWTGSGLNMLCKQADFQIVKLNGLMGLLPTSLQLFQDSIFHKIPTRLLKNIFVFTLQSLMIFFDKCYSRKSKENDACLYLVLAKKK